MAYYRRAVPAAALVFALSALAAQPARSQSDDAPQAPGAMPLAPGDIGGSPGGSDDDRGVVIPRRRMPFFGPTVIGPGGVIPQAASPPRRAEAPRPKVPTPAERAAAIRKALAPKSSFAVVRRQTLDRLYAKLAKAADADEAKGLATLISGIWLRSGSDTASLLMQRAMAASEKKDYSVTLDLLDRVVEMQPNWAEAWNKRASVRFAAGDLNGSMEDVEHVLKIEPNHFAALDGMAMILQRTGFDKRALQVYRRALAVYPHQPEIEEIVKTLSLEVEGQGI